MNKEQAINTAVKWWSNKLKSKQNHSNGDGSFASLFACAIADRGMESVSDDQLVIFENELKASIEADIDTYMVGKHFNSVGLGCDYNPSVGLKIAAKKAGISEFNFPYKTYMRIEIPYNKGFDINSDIDTIDDFKVLVSDGYAQPYQSLNPCE